MAVVTQNANLVWQKVKIALNAPSVFTSSVLTQSAANTAIIESFAGLKAYLAQQKRNPDLQFIAFTAEQAVVNLGTDLVGAACTLYGWYARGRRTTGTTASFLSLNAAADNSASTATVVTARFKAVNQAFAYINGLGLAVETGLTISAATAVGGATESSTADAADGFVIIGAA